MSRSILQAAAAPVMVVAMVIASVGIFACSSSEKSADSGLSAGSGAPVPSPAVTMPPDPMAGRQDSQGMRGSQGMAGVGGDADRDFLRMMSDHHKGLILLAHMTKQRKDGGGAAVDAEKLDAKQDAELDTMMTMLEKNYKDAYAPKAMPAHQAMADDLTSRNGKTYERTFYQDVVKHSQEAIKMIDDYLPRGKNPAVKQMAEKMKADELKEIRDFEKKVSKLGG